MFSIGSHNEYYICRDKVIWSKLKTCKFLNKTGVFQSCLKIVNIFLLICRGLDNLSSQINSKIQHWQLKWWHAKIQTSGGIEHPSQARFFVLDLQFSDIKVCWKRALLRSTSLVTIQCFLYWNTYETEKAAGSTEVATLRMESHSYWSMSMK